MKLGRVTIFLFCLLAFGIGIGTGISNYDRQLGQNIMLGTFGLFFAIGIGTLLFSFPFVARTVRVLTPIATFVATCIFLWQIYVPWVASLNREWQIKHPGVGLTALIAGAFALLMFASVPMPLCWSRRQRQEEVTLSRRSWEDRGNPERDFPTTR